MSATIGTRLMTWWKGRLIGDDQFGNRYYQEKTGPRRWVIYHGKPDATMVPAEWHAWLHHTIEEAPIGERAPIPWEKPHIANMTGSSRAYHPAGSLMGTGKRAKATGDYEAWTPE